VHGSATINPSYAADVLRTHSPRVCNLTVVHVYFTFLCSLGFGFGSQVASVATTPHPSDQPTLVLFILGGISFKEVGQVQQALTKHAVPNTRVIILSTRLVSAENVLYSFFA